MWWLVGLSFLLSVSIIPLIILLCNKMGWYDTQDERKIHKGNIPRLGGVGIIIAFVVSALIYYFLPTSAGSKNHILAIVIAGSIIFIFALADDFFSFKAIFKLIFQIIAVLIVILNGYRFKQIFIWELPLWASYILTFFWMIGIINAYNLIDGLDGLCGGLSFLVISSIGIIYYESAIDIAKFTSGICSMMAAAILGFLVYNKPKAKIFMGDGGSQVMGFMISALPLYNSSSNFEYNKLLVMIVLVSIPMLDTIAAMWRRTREHRSIMSPDSRHIHHKLIALGFTKVQTLVFLLSIQVFICLAAGLGMYLREEKGAILLSLVFVFMVAFYSSIHFIYYTVTNKNPVDIKSIQEDDSSLTLSLGKDRAKSDK